jgi:hypothetical protein
MFSINAASDARASVAVQEEKEILRTDEFDVWVVISFVESLSFSRLVFSSVCA